MKEQTTAPETVHEAALRHISSLITKAEDWKMEHGGDMRSHAEAQMWRYVLLQVGDARMLREALKQIAITTKGYPNASREGEIARAALSAVGQPPAPRETCCARCGVAITDLYVPLCEQCMDAALAPPQAPGGRDA